MNTIRQFQDERKAWEEEREDLINEKTNAAEQLLELSNELERSRAQIADQRPPMPHGTATHHKTHLALMSTIDDLKGELEQERARTPKHTSGLDFTAGKILDYTEKIFPTGRFGSPEAREPEPENPGGSTGSQSQLRSLEDENLRLREELNAEKTRILEFRKADQNRRQAWKAELKQIEADLAEKDELAKRCASLEAECIALRAPASEARTSSERLRKAQAESEGLRRELVAAESEALQCRQAAASAAAQLAQRATRQPPQTALPAAADERSGGRSLREIIGLFLGHSREPLAIVMAACRALGDADATRGVKVPRCPALVDAEGHAEDYIGQLTRVLEAVRFCAKILGPRFGGWNAGAELCLPTHGLDRTIDRTWEHNMAIDRTTNRTMGQTMDPGCNDRAAAVSGSNWFLARQQAGVPPQ